MKPAPLILLAPLLLCLAACDGSNKSGSHEAAAEAEHESAQRDDVTEHHEGEAEHADEDAGGRIALTSEQIEHAGIGLAAAGTTRISEHLSLYGVIVPNAERVREVAARFPGAIRTVTKRVGDAVKQGETLGTIESDESLQTYAVVAPLTGVVTERSANPGEQTGDKALFTVADLSTVWVELSLFPRDVGKVRVGQTVRVKNADTKRAAEGKLVYVAPFGSTGNQTLTARVLLDNANHQWPPGLYVTAEAILGNTEVPVAVASEAIQTLAGQSVIFVRNEQGFELRQVRLGRSDGEFTEVLDGLNPGETYATKNSFILKAELGKGEAEDED